MQNALLHIVAACLTMDSIGGVRRNAISIENTFLRMLDVTKIDSPKVALQINPEVDPCIDFRSFACGGAGGLPHYETQRKNNRAQNFGLMTIANDKVEEAIAEILWSNASEYSLPFSNVLQMYDSCLSLGEEPEDAATLMNALKAWMNTQIDWTPRSPTWNSAQRGFFLQTLARMIKFGAPLFVNVDVWQPDGSGGSVLGRVFDNGFPNIFDIPLEMYPSRTYGFRKLSAAASELLEAYETQGYPVECSGLCVTQSLELLKNVSIVGRKRKNAKYIQAQCSHGPEMKPWMVDDVDDVESVDHEHGLGWKHFCKELGLEPTDPMLWIHMTDEKDGLESLDGPLQEFSVVSLNPTEMMKALEVIMLIKIAPYIGGKVTSTYYSQRNTMSAFILKTIPRNLSTSLGTFCEELPKEHFKWLLARFVGEKAAPARSTEVANRLAGAIQKAFLDTLDDLSWMDSETKNKARIKASAMKFEVGVPAWVHKTDEITTRYSSLHVSDDNSFFANYMEVMRWSFQNKVSGIGKARNLEEWSGSPFMTTPYYNLKLNRIVFPLASMLGQPAFEIDAHPALIYGGLGALVGHELMHGFDKEGSKRNKSGHLTDWWHGTTADEFHKRLDCFKEQYQSMTVDVSGEHIHVDGTRTLSENIADNSGLALAWRALQSSKAEGINNTFPVSSQLELSPDQLFFVGYAQHYCYAQTDYYKKMKLKSGDHAPEEVRIKATLMNSPAFANAFNCAAGSAMNPGGERCSLFDGKAWRSHRREDQEDNVQRGQEAQEDNAQRGEEAQVDNVQPGEEAQVED